MSAIEFKNVYFKYNKSLPLVLNDVSFNVDYNSITLLSGLSGSGKSTILSLISGIIPNLTTGLIKGEIKVNDKSVLNRKLNDITKEVGIVLQNADSQIIQQNVEDEIAFGCENIGLNVDIIDEKINEVSKILSLDPKWKTKTLSGGQKQRLITASILAMGQKILILDEPLANLDTKGSIILLNALKKLALEGYAILLVEHRIDMVLEYVDKIYHIESGKVNLIIDKNEYLLAQSKMILGDYSTNITNLLIKLNHINYKIKDRVILKDINLSINSGEKVLLLGENGCGKTTLSKIIAKLIKPKGEYINNISKKGKWFNHVGVIYQNPNYQLFMPTVGQEIEFNSKNKELVKEVIDLFDLNDLLKRHPQSLSEGQKRKLTVACILAKNPEVIILDEPTVGQDYNSLKKMVVILNMWHHKYNNTMITITHDIRCATALCDKAFWIKEGLIYKSGNKELVNEFFNIK